MPSICRLRLALACLVCGLASTAIPVFLEHALAPGRGDPSPTTANAIAFGLAIVLGLGCAILDVVQASRRRDARWVAFRNALLLIAGVLSGWVVAMGCMFAWWDVWLA
jgi:hypothetical protein